jgi:hypothetical protein
MLYPLSYGSERVNDHCPRKLGVHGRKMQVSQM